MMQQPIIARRAVFFIVLTIAMLAASPAFAEPARPAAWAAPVTLENSDNFFRVTPDLYRSAQPSAEGMRAYEAFGIRTVLNLRALHDDDDEAQGTNLILAHLPTATGKVTDDAFIIKALQAIRDAEKPVLVHCMHGADRTGLVIAMYRMVEQGWSREAALDEMRNGGFGFHSIWTHIPKYLETVDPEPIRKALR